MYYELSKKKLLTLLALAVIMCGATLATYGLRDRYMSRIVSLGNYFRRVPQSIAYAAEFSGLQGNPFTASMLGAVLGETFESPASGRNAGSVPVLVYHGIVEKTGDGINVPLNEFKAQLFALKSAGYTTVTLDDLRAFLKGEKTLPDKSFVLTFDDGRKDTYYPVDPLLHTLNYHAVMFAITGTWNLDHSVYYLSPAEIQAMEEDGHWEVESHTRAGHDTFPIQSDGYEGVFFANKLWLSEKNRLETDEEFKARIAEDFTGSKNDIRHLLGKDAIGFAFPFGNYGQWSKNYDAAATVVTAEAWKEYPLLFAQAENGNFTGNSPVPGNDTFLVRRITVDAGWTPEELVRRMDAARAKPLPYRDGFERDEGWSARWGTASFADGKLRIAAETDTTGAVAFLDGTAEWKNYTYSATLDSKAGTTFSLLVRYSLNGFASCDFSGSEVAIRHTTSDGIRTLAARKGPFTLLSGSRPGVAVVGETVTCLQNGKAVLSARIPGLSERGGIGLKTWDESAGRANATLRDVTIEE